VKLLSSHQKHIRYYTYVLHICKKFAQFSVKSFVLKSKAKPTFFKTIKVFYIFATKSAFVSSSANLVSRFFEKTSQVMSDLAEHDRSNKHSHAWVAFYEISPLKCTGNIAGSVTLPLCSCDVIATYGKILNAKVPVFDNYQKVLKSPRLVMSSQTL